jgi:EAL domain-containing protein (putative c-di-GMP-specific phosphodiesterase class I)
MNYLQQLPVTRLKVDKSFVDRSPNSNDAIAIIKAILSLSEAFNLKVTVEGVEHIDQLEFFKDKYLSDIQGYVYSKSLTIKEKQNL